MFPKSLSPWDEWREGQCSVRATLTHHSLFSTLHSASHIWKKKVCLDNFPQLSPGVNYWHIENWCVMCQIPSIDPRYIATWAKSAVCSGAVLVSTACCKLDKSNLFLSPWPGVFGKSSSLNVCCAATIFYPFHYNMKSLLCFLKALESK